MSNEGETSQIGLPLERVLENLTLSMDRMNLQFGEMRQRIQQLETNRNAPRGGHNPRGTPPPNQRRGHRGGRNAGPVRGRWIDPNDEEIQQGYEDMNDGDKKERDDEDYEEPPRDQGRRHRQRDREDRPRCLFGMGKENRDGV